MNNTSINSVTVKPRALAIDDAKKQANIIDSLEKSVVHYITSSAASSNQLSVKEISKMFLYAKLSLEK